MPGTMRGWKALLPAAMLLAGAAWASAAPLPVAKLRLETQHGWQPVEAELALTLDQQIDGLMWRESMPAQHGMLFAYNPPRIVTMWMKNTKIPLDMLFIDAEGRVAHIGHGVPESTAVISSQVPVTHVLELNAGMAEKWGVALGSRVQLEKEAL